MCAITPLAEMLRAVVVSGMAGDWMFRSGRCRTYSFSVSSFDLDATFGDDYLHFYLPRLGEDRNREDARQIVESLGLIAGQRVLDAPCGHGRFSNVLALQGMEVCAIDKTASFIDLARLNAEELGATVEYRIGDIADLPPDLDGTFRRCDQLVHLVRIPR